MILLDLSTLSAALQALAAVALVILTGWTLVVLRRYAADTKRIAEASVSQTENSQRPFLTVSWKETEPHSGAGWVIHNQGFGPALNVRFSKYANDKTVKWTSIATIAQGDHRKGFQGEIKAHIQNSIDQSFKNRPFILEYSSLAGISYRTTVERLEDADLKTTFQRIS